MIHFNEFRHFWKTPQMKPDAAAFRTLRNAFTIQMITSLGSLVRVRISEQWISTSKLGSQTRQTDPF